MSFDVLRFGVSRLPVSPRTSAALRSPSAPGECVAELLVVGLQLADAGGGRLQPTQQRGIRCALPLRRNLR